MSSATVRVVHLLFPNALPDAEDRMEAPLPLEVTDIIEGLVLRSWPTDHGACVEQDFVMQVAGTPSWSSLAPELIWVREIEGDEIFVTDTSLLLLQPEQITEIPGEYARTIFDGNHGIVYDNALAYLADKAFEQLLQDLGADYEQCFGCPWPEDLPAYILDELQVIDLKSIDCADLTRIGEDIIQKIPAPY